MQNQLALDKYEQEILDAFENGKLHPTFSQANYQSIARNTLERNGQVNHLVKNESHGSKRKSFRKETTYPLYIQKVLHNFIHGFFKKAYP